MYRLSPLLPVERGAVHGSWGKRGEGFEFFAQRESTACFMSAENPSTALGKRLLAHVLYNSYSN